jgi:glycosyltransferase involved in cell wall biosynthesis
MSIASNNSWAAGGCHILALAKYGSRAASTRQRLLQYAPFLAKHQIGIDLRPLLDDTYLAGLMNGERASPVGVARAYARRLGDVSAMRDHDLLWIQYEMFPYLPLIDGLLAQIAPRPIVYDIDDAIFHMYDAHPSAVVRRLLGGKLRPLVRQAATCLCGNEYLADYVTAAGGRAVVVPTVVDTDHFRPRLERGEGPLTVGWIGSPSTWRYVEPLLPALLPAMARLGARFRVVGAGPAARGIEGIDAIEWDEACEVADLQAMDVGLMPVPDQPWARGKCGYKLIQYMACGLPGIASPVGVNSVIVDHGVDGLLAHTQADWVGALEQLARDPDLRARMGAKGRDKVVAHYSLQSQQPVVLDAFRAAMGAGV